MTIQTLLHARSLQVLATLSLYCLFSATTGMSEAGVQSSTSVHVRAMVLPTVKIKVLREPEILNVTEEDLRKGYIDGLYPLILEVRTNTRAGCLLKIVSSSRVVRDVELSIVGPPALRGPDRSTIIIQDGKVEVVSVAYRLLLSRDARPGAYAWPIVVFVSPL